MEFVKGELEIIIDDNTEYSRDKLCRVDDTEHKDIFRGLPTYQVQAYLKEIVRRWNAFEDNGLVDELVKAFKELAATFVGLPEGSIGWQAMKKAEAAIAKVKA